MKLNKDQKRITAEVLGQISVAWFVAGVVAPLFVKNINLEKIAGSFLTGFVLSLLFYLLAIYLLKK